MERTYCPLCGAMDLPTTEQNGKLVAFCGESPERAHTLIEIGVVHPQIKRAPKEPKED